MVRDLSIGPLDDLIGILVASFTLRMDDVRSWHFSLLLLVVHTDDRNIIDKWMIHELAFEFGRSNLEAFVFDEFLHSVGDEKVVIRILIANVAGLEVTEPIFFSD